MQPIFLFSELMLSTGTPEALLPRVSAHLVPAAPVESLSGIWCLAPSVNTVGGSDTSWDTVRSGVSFFIPGSLYYT